MISMEGSLVNKRRVNVTLARVQKALNVVGHREFHCDVGSVTFLGRQCHQRFHLLYSRDPQVAIHT